MCCTRMHACHGHIPHKGCCCEVGRHHRVPNEEERLTTLRNYLEDLKAEAERVEEILRKAESPQ